ncbi:MAG: S8 family serine peptidase, partial [Bdellovibrionales bacterium]|nr:S8 family serine peptidase [Bdellovibrionales bacterium]
AISGTSMACPHVAGLAALIKSANPAFTPAEIQGIINNNATDIGAPGFDTSFGNGVINVEAAVNEALLSANFPPTLLTQDTVDAFVDAPLEISIQATDPEGEPVSLSAQNLPPRAIFDQISKKLAWTPEPADLYQSYTVTFSASDGTHNITKDVVINVKQGSLNPNPPSTNLDQNHGPLSSTLGLGCSVGSPDFSSICGLVVIFLVTLVGTRKRN